MMIADDNSIHSEICFQCMSEERTQLNSKKSKMLKCLHSCINKQLKNPKVDL